jgi:hypothetical protein
MPAPSPTVANIESVTIQAAKTNVTVGKATDYKVETYTAGQSLKVHKSDKPMLKKAGLIP